MWFERFDIIAIVLSKGHLPSTWWRFEPTFVDVGIFIGTIGFFFVLFLLYARTFPVIAQAEVKTILKSSGEFYKKRREQGIPTKPEIIVTDISAITGRSDNNLNG
jgi:molybdopterin-containing oxidoreductase family membrane subunit